MVVVGDLEIKIVGTGDDKKPFPEHIRAGLPPGRIRSDHVGLDVKDEAVVVGNGAAGRGLVQSGLPWQHEASGVSSRRRLRRIHRHQKNVAVHLQVREEEEEVHF